MVQYIGWKEAQARVREEPVIFAEVLVRDPGGQKLEVHVMVPMGDSVHEVERDDTGRIPAERAEALIARIAAERNIRYATMRRAEDAWPPDWLTKPAR
jgi:hypothetical protein